MKKLILLIFVTGLFGDCNKHLASVNVYKDSLDKAKLDVTISGYASLASMHLGFYNKCTAEEDRKLFLDEIKKLGYKIQTISQTPKAYETKNSQVIDTSGTGY